MREPSNLYSSTERCHLDYIRKIIRERQYTFAVELGTHIGGSLVHIAHAIEMNGGGKIIAIDNVQSLLDQTRENFEAAGFSGVELILYCRELPGGIAELPNGMEFVFIDDLHNGEHVAEEIKMLLPKMKAGGTIVGHDTNNPPQIGEAFVKSGGVLHAEGFGLGEIVVATGD